MSLEEKRKRRAKRKAKQARARMERGRLPRFIACHYLMDQIAPDAGVLQDAFECAKDRSRWVQLPYPSLDETYRPSDPSLALHRPVGNFYLRVGKEGQ